jgi:hypothetical protein
MFTLSGPMYHSGNIKNLLYLMFHVKIKERKKYKHTCVRYIVHVRNFQNIPILDELDAVLFAEEIF